MVWIENCTNVINNFISNIELVKKIEYFCFQLGNLLSNWGCQFDGIPPIAQGKSVGTFYHTVISNIPRCTNSMMGRIMEAMMMIRRRVSTVDVLILENNNIPHLPSRAFGSIRVNRLFIENNRMVTIDRNAFAGIEEHLVRLYFWLQNIHICSHMLVLDKTCE